MELVTDQAPRSLRRILLGSTPTQALEFEMAIFAEENINRFQVNTIKKWLFGALQFKKLYILDNSFSDVYFRCILNNPEDVIINGYNGWKFTVQCDSGGSWENEKVVTYERPSGYSYYVSSGVPGHNGTNWVETFNNVSGNNDYLYPKLTFKMANMEYNNTLVVANVTDDGYRSTFQNIPTGYIYTLDGETGMVKAINASDGSVSSSAENVLFNNFNKNYMRFKPGINTLNITGNAAYLKFSYTNFIRLGG